MAKRQHAGVPRIVWRHAPSEKLAAYSRTSARKIVETEMGPAQARMVAALFKTGVPQTEGASTPREDAIGLLKVAAEVEHALMVQYLYAAQSAHAEVADIIKQVAIQEMGHLITVQNLLLALTGISDEGLPASLHLGRDGIRVSSEQNPMPLVLEPLSRESLAKYVVVERPFEIADPTLAARIEKLEALLASNSLSPNPVFEIYAAIRWIFQTDDQADLAGLDLGSMPFVAGWHLKDDDFIPRAISLDYASQAADWGSKPGLIVMPASTREEALAAIDAITAQGEGLPGATESHFASFISVLDQFETGTIPARALARTPFVPSQPDPEDQTPTPITNPYSALWAELFNCLYELMLIDISWAISLKRSEPSRSAMIKIAINMMRRVLGPLADYMSARPVDNDPSNIAGPTYGLSDETLPTTTATFAARYTNLRSRQSQCIAAIRAHPEFATDVTGKQRLSRIEQLDTERAPNLPEGI
ncbi:hypothetical protein C7S18_09510 [Ahniella affigens]|uniref:Iminophenyl-pyruvate dimer synthase domain-containing protein n=1 Tax=Ahniella affigens TaxID=2021234 RepID=A0A2P1PRD9_9GAMM|nr:ferritin-like domain-containing protein [Ahniella affigens]AVP97416.1 hypothetical protein C7S18_09510 [Ahniella affigens]